MKQETIKKFNGKLNLDKQQQVIPPEDYISAFNITRNSALPSSDGPLSSMLGNQAVAYQFTFPSGVNKRIGHKEDVVRNRIYVFVWNSAGQHFIYYYDNVDKIAKLLLSQANTGGIDILNFNPSFKINHIDIVYRPEGDLLFWTDGFTQPRAIIVDKIIAGTYGTIEQAFTEAAKRPPLTPLTVTFGDDSTRLINALRGKLYQSTYRFVYDDLTKSSWSPWSVVPLPINVTGNDNDLDPTKNNFISITIPDTGKKNVLKLEVAVHSNNAGIYGNFYLIETLIKSESGISDNSTYVFKWYNNGIYPSLDQVESTLLYDYIPLLAKAQCMPNGNVLAYAAYTEGYPNLTRSQMNVTMTPSLVTNGGVDTGGNVGTLTYTNTGASAFQFTVGNNVPVGTTYKILMNVLLPPRETVFVAQYTSIVGDTSSNVAVGLYNYAVSHFAQFSESVSFNTFSILTNDATDSVVQLLVFPPIGGGVGGTTINSQSTYNWSSRYRFGLVYYDLWGRIIGGVQTYYNQVADNNDFEIETGAFNSIGGVPQTPVIDATISHTPPPNAVKYGWVRSKNLSIDRYLQYVISEMQSDADFLYFCLENVRYFSTNNNKFIYSTIDQFVAQGDRILIQTSGDTSGYTGVNYNQDFEIVGVVQRLMTSGNNTVATDTGSFVKVKKPVAAFTFGSGLAMVYTPSKSNNRVEDSFYYEFGEFYDIYTLNGVNYHKGQSQDQTASVPATFRFISGDCYYRPRKIYLRIVSTLSTLSASFYMMDSNYSDYYQSSVNSNGRTQIVDPNAKQSYFAASIRNGQAFQANTNINQLNRFYPGDLDDYDISVGDIRKLFIEGRYLYVFQKFDVGVVPVLTQIIQDTANNPLNAESTKLLNKIQYPYKGKYGIGDCPESFAYFNYAKYFYDPNRAEPCRLSQDGITPLGTTYDCTSLFFGMGRTFHSELNNGIAANGTIYTGDATVYGAYDYFTQKYILAFEQIDRYSDPFTLSFHQDPFTLTFNETRDASEGFESFTSFFPEGMGSIGMLLFSFKNGALWTHDNNAAYCNYYGVQYNPSIHLVYNEHIEMKKNFLAMSYQGNQTWECPNIGDIQTSRFNQDTGLRQQSQLLAVDYEQIESRRHAALLRDVNSMSDPVVALIQGDPLAGSYIEFNFVYKSTGQYAWIFLPVLVWIPSNKFI